MNYQYTKRPVVIEAFQMTAGHRHSKGEWPEWLHKAWNKPFEKVGSLFLVATSLLLTTHLGPVVVSLDDWIVRKGSLLSVLSTDVFVEMYQAIGR